MDMLNDHIRLVQFGYDGDVEKINLLLRLALLSYGTSKGPFYAPVHSKKRGLTIVLTYMNG